VTPIDQAKVISYLKTTDRRPALIIDLHVSTLKDGIQRIVFS